MERRCSLRKMLKEIYRAGPETEAPLANLLARILKKLTKEEHRQ